MQYVLMFLLFTTAVFLIVLVLIQRGKGGGLAGALGGMGGQSAFGTKAGDLFTKITIGVAGFWILLCVVSVFVLGRPQSQFGDGKKAATPEAPATPGEPGEGGGAPQPVPESPPGK
jgi:preprotein translocase subunit SecG